jgi:hypothetical protein
MVTSLIKKAKEIHFTPKVVKGTHLTVTTHPDGRTELEWDDEALMRDVREALESVETKPAKKKAAPKKATKVEEPKTVEKPKTKRKTKEKK